MGARPIAPQPCGYCRPHAVAFRCRLRKRPVAQRAAAIPLHREMSLRNPGAFSFKMATAIHNGHRRIGHRGFALAKGGFRMVETPSKKGVKIP
jgi:hypothetical protein